MCADHPVVRPHREPVHVPAAVEGLPGGRLEEPAVRAQFLDHPRQLGRGGHVAADQPAGDEGARPRRRRSPRGEHVEDHPVEPAACRWRGVPGAGGGAPFRYSNDSRAAGGGQFAGDQPPPARGTSPKYFPRSPRAISAKSARASKDTSRRPARSRAAASRTARRSPRPPRAPGRRGRRRRRRGSAPRPSGRRSWRRASWRACSRRAAAAAPRSAVPLAAVTTLPSGAPIRSSWLSEPRCVWNVPPGCRTIWCMRPLGSVSCTWSPAANGPR